MLPFLVCKFLLSILSDCSDPLKIVQTCVFTWTYSIWVFPWLAYFRWLFFLLNKLVFGFNFIKWIFLFFHFLKLILIKRFLHIYEVAGLTGLEGYLSWFLLSFSYHRHVLLVFKCVFFFIIFWVLFNVAPEVLKLMLIFIFYLFYLFKLRCFYFRIYLAVRNFTPSDFKVLLFLQLIFLNFTFRGFILLNPSLKFSKPWLTLVGPLWYLLCHILLYRLHKLHVS